MNERNRNASQEIADCARNAALNAASTYYEMSDGKSVHEAAIETFVSSKIAEAIFRETKHHVLLEPTFATIHELSGSERRGRSAVELPPTARFDVAIMQDSKPIGLIEVKKRFAPFKAEKDVIRLTESVRRYGERYGGSIQFGLWIALQRTWEGQRKEVSKRISDFRDGFEWSIQPDIRAEETSGQFGTARNKKNVVGLVAYSALFVPEC